MENSGIFKTMKHSDHWIMTGGMENSEIFKTMKRQ
jgi:hypothetical protein